MPTYEYNCTKCGTFDVEQRITEPRLSACDRCGGPVERLISRTSFALRGGGWYADGYGSGGSKPSGSCATSEGGCGAGACARAEA